MPRGDGLRMIKPDIVKETVLLTGDITVAIIVVLVMPVV
jgi:hypothetical protein